MSASDEQIIEALPMVRRMASRYHNTPLGAEEALGVGTLALVEAGLRFEERRGVPFMGFAFQRVKGAMRDASQTQTGAGGGRPAAEVPHDPDVLAELAADVRTARPDGHLDLVHAMARLRLRLRRVLVQHACGVPHGQIARDMGVSESRVSQLLGLARRRLCTEAGVRLR